MTGNWIRTTLFVAGAALVVAFSAPADAGKPRNGGGDFLGNGFPSGPHFNLLLLGKKDHFSCPAPVFEVLADGNGDGDLGAAQTQAQCDAEGDTCGAQVFGNVVFMPRKDDPLSSNYADPITILIESGRKGPKSSPAASELEVTDWCTESFVDFGANGQGDGATLRLPKDPEGYAVYARITGKPGDGDGATFSLEGRELKLVEDQFGNDLLLLGLINEDGAFTPDGQQLTRFDSTKSGKGAQTATDITALFQFVGTACNVNDVTGFCVDENGNDILDQNGDPVCFDRVDENGIVKQICCGGANLDSNGEALPAPTCPSDPSDPSDGYAFCADNAVLNVDQTAYQCPVSYEFDSLVVGEVEDLDATDVANGGTCDTNLGCFPDPDNDGDGICEPAETCELGDAALCEAVPQCRTFTESDGQWIFNIADFVNLELNSENNGSYNVQIRFYPLPLNTDAQ